MSTIRSVPDATLRAYLLPISAFAIALMALWAADMVPLALTILYLLSVYNLGLTTWWSRRLFYQSDSGELRDDEVRQGLAYVCRILGWSSCLPGELFAATDPISPEVWGTVVSTGILTTIALVLAPRLVRLERRPLDIAALALALAALPLNTSGTLSMAFWLGWVEVLTGAP